MNKPRNPQKENHIRGRLLIIAGVVLLVTAILLLKDQETEGTDIDYPTTAEQISMNMGIGALTQAAPTRELAQLSETPTILSPTTAPQPLPEVQLDRYLADGQPILAFFHSNTCDKCIQMTKIVEQVYPDFTDRVALVDVNVYDQRNQNLLQRAGIQVIPTLIFIGRDQQGQGYTGVMPAEALREQLEVLAQEP